MADWYQLAQSIIFGLIFAYLLAKLISILLAFKDENLSLTRNHTTQSEYENLRKVETLTGISGETDSLIAEQGSLRGDEDESDDDDWEGVESTELDEAFSAATAFVAAAASDRLSQKVSNELQLQLYGLYKIATEGPCTAPQPSALKMTARAKWQAWQKLGAMPPEEAMEKYIDLVTQLYPAWVEGGSVSCLLTCFCYSHFFGLFMDGLFSFLNLSLFLGLFASLRTIRNEEIGVVRLQAPWDRFLAHWCTKRNLTMS
jgi:acyl-CoA-binding protein